MSYTAKSLDEIAAMFESRAANADALLTDALRPRTQAGEAVIRSEASTWRRAADILRRTTLTEPCHMETP